MAVAEAGGRVERLVAMAQPAAVEENEAVTEVAVEPRCKGLRTACVLGAARFRHMDGD